MSLNGLMLVLLVAMALFLILLVLIQRGRGGGLTGALGGMGGQSAFGAKAGDTFTKITMWTAFLWIVLCIVAFKVISASSEQNIAGPGLGPDGGGMRGVETLDGDGGKADESSDTGPASPGTPPAEAPAE